MCRQSLWETLTEKTKTVCRAGAFPSAPCAPHPSAPPIRSAGRSPQLLSPAFVLHLNGLPQSVLLGVWFLSLHTVLMGCFYVVWRALTCSCSPPIHGMDTPQLIHPLCWDGHLGCFQLGLLWARQLWALMHLAFALISFGIIDLNVKGKIRKLPG